MSNNQKIEIATQLISGFHLLESAEQEQFFLTITGQNLTDAIVEYQRQYAKISFWSMYFYNKNMSNILPKLQKELFLKIKNHAEFTKITVHISYVILSNSAEIIKLHDKNIIINYLMDYYDPQLYQKLSILYYNINELCLKKIRGQLNHLNFNSHEITKKIKFMTAQLKLIISTWLTKFHQQCDQQYLIMINNTWQNSIVIQNTNPEPIYFLSEALPILYYTYSQITPYNLLVSYYSNQNTYQENKQQVLYDTLSHYINQYITQYLNYINLTEFNHIQINNLLNIINNDYLYNQITIKELLMIYAQNLCKYIEQSLYLYNNHVIKKMANTFVISKNAISALFAKQIFLNRTKDFFKNMANTHAFLQKTGMTTQNDGSFLAILDLYNYLRFAPILTNSTDTIKKILAPLQIIINEYYSISNYERHLILKITRSIMPLIILIGFCLGILILLNILAVPEIGLILATIPTILIGFFVVALYIKMKDYLYNSLRNLYYGSKYNTPEFQLNQRLLAIYPPAITIQIKECYINIMQKCEAKENAFAKNANLGLLSTNEIDMRNDNLKYYCLICAEWYDIHSNFALATTIAKQIINNRIKQYIKELKNDLLIAYEQEFTLLTQSIYTEINNLAEILSLFTSRLTANQISINNAHETLRQYQPNFFQPAQVTINLSDCVKRLNTWVKN